MERAGLIMTLSGSSKARLGHLRARDYVIPKDKCRTVHTMTLPAGLMRVVSVVGTPALLSLLVSDRCLSGFRGLPFLSFQSRQGFLWGCCKALVP